MAESLTDVYRAYRIARLADLDEERVSDINERMRHLFREKDRIKEREEWLHCINERFYLILIAEREDREDILYDFPAAVIYYDKTNSDGEQAGFEDWYLAGKKVLSICVSGNGVHQLAECKDALSFGLRASQGKVIELIYTTYDGESIIILPSWEDDLITWVSLYLEGEGYYTLRQ